MKLTFSHIVDGQRVPLVIDGHEASLEVEAKSKSEVIFKAEVIAFCKEHDCRVRRIT